ncbi:MAG: DUF721 domain-containing protein [Planctomycetes bacterium]|nr:DUF721 domain-containing protein [Planctomycetota bacterium]MBI3848258.1 DUF721 domain-containing protein [Planctomycetota bacterium]
MAEAEPIGSLVRQILRRRDTARRRVQDRVTHVLMRLVGGDVAAQVRVREIRGGVLRLTAASAALREELGVYRAQEFRAALESETPPLAVQSIRFEIE